MEPRKLIAALGVAEKLKNVTRHCDTSGGRRESVAEHSWRAALMACLMKDEFPEADMDKVVRMIMIHDLGECFTGDIPVFNKTAQHEEKEKELLYDWVKTLPEDFSKEMLELYVQSLLLHQKVRMTSLVTKTVALQLSALKPLLTHLLVKCPSLRLLQVK